MSKHWRRSGGLGPGAQALTCHQVLSVVTVDDIATWTFDGDVDAITDLTAFLIDGNPATSIVIAIGPAVQLAYLSDDLSNKTWSLDPSGVDFQDLKPACPGQTGVTT